MEIQVRHRISASAAVAFALSIFSSFEAAATTQRTFIASTGNDAAACSLAQPCRVFARAISQTSIGGEVIVLDSAGYGPVTITKSVSLIAPGGIYADTTVFSGDGIAVNALRAIVVLSGLSISGQGGVNGVNILNAARLRIESCVGSGTGIDGSKTRLWASANHFSGLTSLNFVQTDSASFWSHGNNTGSDSYTGTYVQFPTF